MFGLILMMLATACREPSYGGPEYDVRPATTTPWSGAQLDLYSPGFAPPARPGFLLDGQVLPAARRDDTTYAVSLPAVPTRQVTIEVRFPDDTALVGPLTLYGFRDARLGPVVKGAAHLWPSGRMTSVVVASSNGVALYDVAANVLGRQWSDSLHRPGCNFGPGTSYRGPGTVVLQAGTCAWLKSWDMSGVPTVVDSAPWRCCGWAIVEMAPGRWLITEDDQFYVRECANGACTLREAFGYSTDEAVLSPRGDRVALGGYYPFGGGPWVLDTGTGDSAYSIPALYESYGAAFSPDGDTLFVVGRAAQASGVYAETLILVLDAATGGMIDSTRVPRTETVDWKAAVALDPLDDLLFVAGWSAGSVVLLVYRRSTLDLVTVLRVPSTEMIDDRWVETRVIAAPLERLIFVFGSPLGYDPPNQPIGVYRFDRAP